MQASPSPVFHVEPPEAPRVPQGKGASSERGPGLPETLDQLLLAPPSSLSAAHPEHPARHPGTSPPWDLLHLHPGHRCCPSEPSAAPGPGRTPGSALHVPEGGPCGEHGAPPLCPRPLPALMRTHRCPCPEARRVCVTYTAQYTVLLQALDGFQGRLEG